MKSLKEMENAIQQFRKYLAEIRVINVLLDYPVQTNFEDVLDDMKYLAGFIACMLHNKIPMPAATELPTSAMST